VEEILGRKKPGGTIKSLVVYSNFTDCRKGFVVLGVCRWARGRMDWIDLAKDRDTHVVWPPVTVIIFGHSFVALRCLLSSLTYTIRAWNF
jgi:hypothetical protein